ncbi:archaellin/type IV pilin N-terminal domain-containing protein [Halosolutus amylolyticus]|uniref:Archaellin/type IV pilin N-terminal domain-containing protein n=1 Tax=Halosolutus amylolyticus TaxID=2932267 RepID=A0ABD5PN86_9EURY|nr:archaellin/type IV pilin N-terminal domain-containing protein [Halosolutus amylolyticus]
MSRSLPSRAQTEPIAALIAVMAVVVGVGVYAVYAGNALPGGTDRGVEETTIDLVWKDIEDEDRGVFPAYEYESDTDAKMRDAIDRESLPYGKNVYIEIWAYDDGEPTVFAAAHFDSDGDSLGDQQITSSEADFGPPREAGEPDDTGIATRPISIEVEPADVRGGTLHVEVW